MSPAILYLVTTISSAGVGSSSFSAILKNSRVPRVPLAGGKEEHKREITTVTLKRAGARQCSTLCSYSLLTHM